MRAIRILGIDHVALNVRDLQASLEFYTGALGLKISEREHQKPGVEHFLDCGSSLVGLIQGDGGGERHPFRDGGIGANHFSFRVHTGQFDRIVSELKLRGVPIKFTKKREKSWSVYFEDPDGNKLEMTAWPQEDNKV
jgi:catechol 2,3-dioxygenase-like lactoylglutathione lyase family enzyme